MNALLAFSPLLWLALIADLISIVLACKSSRPGKRRWWVLAVIILSTLVVIQAVYIQRGSGMKAEARRLLVAWPEVDRLEFASTGEIVGIILDGKRFFEQHRNDFPETYESASKIIDPRFANFEADGTQVDFDEERRRRIAARTIIQFVESAAELGPR